MASTASIANNDASARLPLAVGVAAWTAMLLLGAATILADRLLAAPAAGPAKTALLSILGGEIRQDADALTAILLYGSGVFLTPLLVLAAFVAIDRLVEGRGARRRKPELAWLVQAVFITLTNILLIAIAQLDLRPEPLISIEREAASALYWLKALPLLLLGFFIADVLFYWLHRAQHRFPILWRFHSIHHSQDLDVLHNINHPVEMLASYLLVIVPTSLLLRVEAAELLLLTAFFAIQGWLNHLRAPINLGPLGVILSDNRYHFIHHSRDPADFNANFAARFPVIDRMFGTYRPGRRVLPATGLADRPPPPTLRHYLFASWPGEADRFRDMDSAADEPHFWGASG